MSDELNELFKKLHDSLSREPSVKDFSMHVDITDRLNRTLQLEIPAIIKTLDQLKVARQKVHDPSREKDSVGEWFRLEE